MGYRLWDVGSELFVMGPGGRGGRFLFLSSTLLAMRARADRSGGERRRGEDRGEDRDVDRAGVEFPKSAQKVDSTS